MRENILRFILVIVFCFPVFAIGQGTIQGKIWDKKSNESIVGASVYIEGTTIGASTDIDGKYIIKNVKHGTHTIIVSFISYKIDTIRGIKVQKEKVTTLDHALTEMTTQLSEVTVAARKKTDTDISVINKSKQSNLIIVGVSSQQIAKSQDKDASEVIRRLPGVTIIGGRFVVVRGLIERYNTVWLNNAPTPSSETDQRAFSFDVIPSNMIGNLTIYKTPAPELPADFAGAFINIATKNLPENNSVGVGFTTTLYEGTTFNNFQQYKGSNTDWLGFDNSTRALPGDVPSTEEMVDLQNYNSGTPEEQAYRKGRMLDIAHSFTKISSSEEVIAPIDYKLNIDLSNRFAAGKAKLGTITAISYKTTHNTANIERSSVESYGTSTTGVLYSKQYDDMQYSKGVGIGVIHNWSLSVGKSLFEFCNLFSQTGLSVTTIRNGIDHYRDDNKVYKTQLAYASRTIYSGSLGGTHNFREGNSTLNWTAGYSYASLDEPDRRLITYYAGKKDDSTYYPYQLEYTSNANSDANARLYSNVKENNYSGSLNYQHTFLYDNFKPQIKAGIFAEHKERDFYIRPFGIIWAKPGVYNQEILHQPIDSVYYDVNFNFEDGVMYREVSNSSYTYNVNNLLYAGYLSVKIPLFSFINIYGGLRVEENDMNLLGPSANNEMITKVRRDTLSLFPSVNLTFNLNEKNLIRLAYGRTINRPEFREIAPFSFYDFQENVVIYGNDSLQSCFIDNFDLRYEWYPTTGEMVTIGAFYKNFSNPIEATWIPSSSGDWDLRYLNANHAYSFGAEIDIRKNFLSLGKKKNFLRHFRNFSLVLNASLIKCRVETDLLYVRDQNRPMYGQSPYIVNAGLYYQTQKNDMAISLLYNVFGKRIVGIGTPDIPNSYEIPRNVLDFTFLKKLGKSFVIKFGVKDILNQPVAIEQVMQQEGLPDAVITVKSFKPGRSYSLGITYTLDYN